MVSLLIIFVATVAVVTAGYAVMMLLFAWGLKRLARNQIAEPTQWPSVSVIMPARNEAGVLPWTLRSLMRQDYKGEWQVIVVDDRSDDATPVVLADLARGYPQLRIVRIVESAGGSPKKFALSQGIAAATGEIIVTTDADCQYDEGWLRGLVMHLADGVGVVAGLTIFDLPEYRTVPAWQKIQWLDFFVQNFLAAGSLGWGHAASCNGSNLCFRREVYDQISGYGATAEVVSGDDVLFAQRVAAGTSWKMVFATRPETIVRSLPVANLRELLHQRLRWASKGLTYRGSMLGFLFAVYAYYLALLALPVAAAFQPQWWNMVAAVWGTKLVVDSVLIVTGAFTFRQQRLLPHFPAYEMLHIVFTPFIGFAGLLLPYHWKGDWYRTATLPGSITRRWLKLPARSKKSASDMAAQR